MSREFYTADSAGNPTALPFEVAANALLAPLLNYVIWAFDVILTDKAPASTRFFRLIIDSEPIGVTLNSPYVVKTFEAYDDKTGIAMAQAFMALNPAWFYAPLMYRYSDQLTGQSLRTVLILIYCEDGSGGAANWLPATGSVSTTTDTTTTTSTTSTSTTSTTSTTTTSTSTTSTTSTTTTSTTTTSTTSTTTSTTTTTTTTTTTSTTTSTTTTTTTTSTTTTAAPPGPATWDPANKGTTTLSNANRTSADNSPIPPMAACFSTAAGKTTGKYYYEIALDLCDVSNILEAGIIKDGVAYSSGAFTDYTSAMGFASNGYYFKNGVFQGSIGASAQGDIWGFVWDLDALTWELFKNNVSFSTGVITTGGTGGWLLVWSQQASNQNVRLTLSTAAADMAYPGRLASESAAEWTD